MPLFAHCWCSGILRTWLEYLGQEKSTQGLHLKTNQDMEATLAFRLPNLWMCGVILTLPCKFSGLVGILSVTLALILPSSAVGGEGPPRIL